LEIEHLGPRVEPEPPQEFLREQRHMLAVSTIDLHEVAPPEILDPRQIGLARFPAVDKRQPMGASLLVTSLRVLTWCCVILLAVLSLLPAQEMVRTGFPGRLEHFVAYAGSAAIAMAGYCASRGSLQIIGGFWVYAGILEYLQNFSPGRHPAIEDFAASALGALCGGLAIDLLWRRLAV
jgi:VanZ family protein